MKKALEAITECVKTGKGNLLELAVEAARVRASLGEISDACEAVVGRYKATIRTISGVYSSEIKNNEEFKEASEKCAAFAKKEGRQPRPQSPRLPLRHRSGPRGSRHLPAGTAPAHPRSQGRCRGLSHRPSGRGDPRSRAVPSLHRPHGPQREGWPFPQVDA